MAFRRGCSGSVRHRDALTVMLCWSCKHLLSLSFLVIKNSSCCELCQMFWHTVRRNSSLVFSQRLLRFIWVWNIDNPVMYPADVSGCYCDVVVATVISARRAHPVEKCLTGKTSIMVDWEIVFGSYIGEQHSLQCKLYVLSELSSLKRIRRWTHCLIRTSFVCFDQEMFVS